MRDHDHYYNAEMQQCRPGHITLASKGECRHIFDNATVLEEFRSKVEALVSNKAAVITEVKYSDDVSRRRIRQS